MTIAVIFDLYGTLIHLARNSNPYFRLCRTTGDVTCVRKSLVVDALTPSDFCVHLGIAMPPDIREIERDLAADIESAAVFHDTVSTLQALRSSGIRLGVISNLASPYKLPFFTLGLDSLMDAVAFSCDLGVAKPDPAIYHNMLAALGVDGAQAVMVGDSKRSDVVGPSACGIRGVLLDRDGTSNEDSCIGVLSDVMSVVAS